MIPKYAALFFTIASSVAALFQVALALGAPWGEFTLGGRWRGRLPARVRLIPVLSAALLGFFCMVVLARTGQWVATSWQPAPWLIWLVVAYCALGCFANAITPSPRERRIWLPVVLSMFATSMIVAVS